MKRKVINKVARSRDVYIWSLSRNSLVPFHWKRGQVGRFNYFGRNTMYLRFHLKWQTFFKVPNIKFHGNPSCGRCADICGQTDGDGPQKYYRRFSRLCGHSHRGSNYIPL